MTEAEWLACNLLRMVEELPDRVSERQLRLFACACCRKIWRLLPDKRSRKAVETSERYADGQASARQLASANRAAWAAWKAADKRPDGIRPESAAEEEWWVLRCAARVAEQAALPDSNLGALAAARQTNLVDRMFPMPRFRDLIGNPFRPVTFDAAWRNADVVSLAQAAYDERHMPSGELDSQRLLVLADALEEAGCADELILRHLREPGLHVRGCWPIDLVLGKH